MSALGATSIIIGIITIVSTILSIILFFKVWGMTNDVDKMADDLRDIKRYLISQESDSHMMFLYHYTDDIGKLLTELMPLRTDVKIKGLDKAEVDYEWIEDYRFAIVGRVPKASINFNILASCDGDPRLRASWTFSLAPDGNFVPEGLMA